MNDFTQFLMSHGHPLLFAIVLVEQAGLPLPAAPWLLAAGALSANGDLNPLLAIAVTVLACVLADWAWFLVGRRGGQRVLRGFCRLSLAQHSCVGRTKTMFARYGLQGLVVAKFLPGLGAVMPPLAGALGMSARQFFLFDGLGSLFYGMFYILAGFLFHTQLRSAVALLNQLGFSAVLAVLLLVTAYTAYKYLRRRGNLLERKETAGTRGFAPRIRVESPATLEFRNPSLALTGTPTSQQPGDPPSSIDQPAPCQV